MPVPLYTQDYSDSGLPVLVIGDTHASRFNARKSVEASGLRVLDALTPEQALGRLDKAPSLSAIWAEFEDAPTLAGHRLLERADRSARTAQLAVVVATRMPHIDEVLCGLSDKVNVLVDADEVERVATFALACSEASNSRVFEMSSEASAARLRQLSEEVSRIASALARLSTTSNTPPLSPATMAPPQADLPTVSAEGLRAIIKARRLRASYLPADLFADPAWDMLLDLLQAEIAQHRVPVSSLCIAAAVPATTALRWIKTMTDRGLLVRRDDPHDGRRVFIEMAPMTSAALRRYFQEAGMAAA
jgi:DNA-binding MarR family transcriptional regulator